MKVFEEAATFCGFECFEERRQDAEGDKQRRGGLNITLVVFSSLDACGSADVLGLNLPCQP